jgi:putative membrane protein
MLSEPERARISEAISAAERRTSGEIVAVLAAESDTYVYAPILWAAIVALFVPWPLIFFTWLPVQSIFAVQLIVFLLVALLAYARPLRYALVPDAVKRSRAHRRAVEQFLAQNLHTTKGRTGILIFVSAAERYVEVIADAQVRAKAGDEVWRGLVEQLTSAIGAGRAADGFLGAIATSGEILSRHFPPGSSDENELPDHMIVLE